MVTLASIDLSGFNGLIAMTQEALIGAGQDGDLQTIVKNVGADLAMEISNSLGPRSKEVGEATIRKDLRTLFQELPPHVFSGTRSGAGNMVWLTASPNRLWGVEMDDYQPSASESDMRDSMRANPSQRVGISSKFYRPGRQMKQKVLGQHGRQGVIQINRIMVERGRIDALSKDIAAKRVGRLRAMFAYAAHMLGRKRIPGWIKSKFESVRADGTAIFDQTKLQNKSAPILTFGASAPGLIENFEERIFGSVERASSKLYNTISALIHGYAHDWASAKKVSAKTGWMKNKP